MCAARRAVSNSSKDLVVLQIQTLWDITLLFVEGFDFRFLKVIVGDSRAPLTKSKHTCLSANSFDICARELVFRHHELLNVDVLAQCHSCRVDAENVPPAMKTCTYETATGHRELQAG